ncbi:MAG: Polyribonucleotide nucleotidyltransferase [Chlamydiae bacterium]|nr:Polyribonucleotide nucleotidyltransferase [Chlamydiota bacterium]
MMSNQAHFDSNLSIRKPKENKRMTIEFQHETLEIEVGELKLCFETGHMARQASGSVVLKVGDTMLFSAVTTKKEASEDIDFLPLRVDYQEKFSSAGKTLGGFIKREGRPTQRETLMSRLIDRPIRPLFPKGFYNEVQIATVLLSYDGETSPDPLALCATSAALSISEAPFANPIGAVRVGLINEQFVINPTMEQQKESKLDLLLAGTKDAILMIEGYCDFLSEEQIIEAIELGHESIKKICVALIDWKEKVGKKQNFDTLSVPPEELYKEIKEFVGSRLKDALALREKQPREEAMSTLKKEVMNHFFPEGTVAFKFKKRDVALAYKETTSRVMREAILESNSRPDGRKTDQVRPIHIKQSLLPRAHGSSLFTRGETQALAIATIGGLNMGQRYETVHEADIEQFYLQYFFPPYSVGEVGRIGPPGRREVGHGKLAERALRPTLPSKTEFPYTIRLESQIMESNGSSSMASVCGGSLALMDAGVPVLRPISGIAMGLILEEDKFVILSDISGTEDALGDMDFKLTGDADGITAFQMDIKVEGITHEIMRQALAQAKAGRQTILEKMVEVCPKAKKELSKWAPRIVILQVKPSQIGTIIGPGGKQIRAITEETGVELDIDDEGVVHITGADPAGVERAKNIVEDLVAEVEIGAVYEGKIVSIVNFGMFVQVIGGKEGLCHISEIANTRVDDITGLFKEGDPLKVKVLDINDRGQIKLSHKATL